MNACEQALRLNAYHDGEMTSADCAELEQHLRQCPSCAAELNRIGKLTTLLCALPAPRMSAGTLDRLHRLADRLPRPGILRLAESLAALAALILLACTLSLSWQGPMVPTVPVSSPPVTAAGAPVPASEAALPVWEADVVPPQPGQPGELVAETSEDSLVRWMVQDLNRKDGHD